MESTLCRYEGAQRARRKNAPVRPVGSDALKQRKTAPGAEVALVFGATAPRLSQAGVAGGATGDWAAQVGVAGGATANWVAEEAIVFLATTKTRGGAGGAFFVHIPILERKGFGILATETKAPEPLYTSAEVRLLPQR